MAGELLKLPWVDLRMRMARLDIPLRVGPETIEELRAEIEAFEKWKSRRPVERSTLTTQFLPILPWWGVQT